MKNLSILASALLVAGFAHAQNVPAVITEGPALAPSAGYSGGAPRPRVSPAKAGAGQADIPMPKMTAPTPAPPLEGTAAAAAAKSAEWRATRTTPTLGEDGRVTYTFGAAVPVLVCAPLRLCVIELQPGEKVINGVQMGDAVRWVVTPAETGSGPTAQTLVVIKPKEEGLSTNLMIPTNRRVYYFQLTSHSKDHTSRVAFEYPEDAKAAWAALAAKQAERSANEVATMNGAGAPAGSAIDRLAFDYSIEGDAKFKPTRVVDDGTKTYIQLPAAVRSDELPVLVVLANDGKEQLVNSRFKNGWYEVDRLFDRAALILGVGRDQQKVVITSATRYKPKSWFSSSNYGGGN